MDIVTPPTPHFFTLNRISSRYSNTYSICIVCDDCLNMSIHSVLWYMSGLVTYCLLKIRNTQNSASVSEWKFKSF